MIKKKHIALFVFIFCTLFLKAQTDSVSNPDYIKRFMVYKSSYPFINYKQNFIEWKDFSAISHFLEKLKETPRRKLKVLHIGDSHIQADVFTTVIRDQLQKIFGRGGRGFIFPYAAAKTHAAWDYRTYAKGKWDFTRNVMKESSLEMGITGATVFTTDSMAHFGFNFVKFTAKDSSNILHILSKKSSQSYGIKIKINGMDSIFHINFNATDNSFSPEVKIPFPIESLECSLVKTDSSKSYFECYGLLLESAENKGILYNSVGINGAGYYSILHENLLASQLSDLNPDLVIIDLGGNDFLPGKINIPDMETNLGKIIDLIKCSCPETSVIVSCSQDAYRRRKNYAECLPFSQLTRKVAFEKKCAHYNYYHVAGERFSMLKWLKNKLAQKDRTHLTNAGYNVKGELYTQALLNAYYFYLTQNKPDSFLVYKMDTVKLIQPSFFVKNSNDSLKKDSLASIGNKVAYTVLLNDKLGIIARKFSVKSTDIKKWNNLKSNQLEEGDELIIYTQKNEIKSPKIDIETDQKQEKKKLKKENQKDSEKKKNEDIKNDKIAEIKKLNSNNEIQKNKSINTDTTNKNHIIKKGDTLSGIAKKYKVSINELKKLNNLNSDKINLGQNLIIRK